MDKNTIQIKRYEHMMNLADQTEHSEEEFIDEENELVSTNSDGDPPYYSEESDSDDSLILSSDNEGEENEEIRNNLETLQDTNNIETNLKETSDSDSIASETPIIEANQEWNIPQGNHKDFGCSYRESEGIRPEFAAAMINESPLQHFRLFLDSQILEEMVSQTNLYATQVSMAASVIPANSRIRKWYPTSPDEMLKFLGLIGYMGLVKMPSIRHYWSRKLLYRNSVSNIMSRNRFELLLHFWHFTDNEMCPPGNRVHKFQPFLDTLVKKYQQVFTPGSTFCIDESLVPFRGRLIFKQYIPLKTHKYGIKIFKLCSGGGYTWNMRIYCGKEQDAGASVPTNVVLSLAESLLDEGRTAITDNYYTSLDLANKLLERKTHLLGTLRSNRRGNPKDVTQKKLKLGEIIGRENAEGICIMKWRDKRDVLLLSTKHIDSLVEVNIHGEKKYKPKAVIDYNKGKSSIDISDQMASYNSAIRRTMKWYRKVAVEAI
ncbi:piggyBac transposable element-derived protein 4-like [Coccinella septempunctata]|uniref:piggyBac transposable element-derived protein 4-like n=1 Tax=Coccinella septempunctata TaxID=41139 RepID=UPI001D06AF05|nr:piggyBac transposable element-derived protein 4-like [Coccinella septempunctata]